MHRNIFKSSGVQVQAARTLNLGSSLGSDQGEFAQYELSPVKSHKLTSPRNRILPSDSRFSPAKIGVPLPQFGIYRIQHEYDIGRDYFSKAIFSEAIERFQNSLNEILCVQNFDRAAEALHFRIIVSLIEAKTWMCDFDGALEHINFHLGKGSLLNEAELQYRLGKCYFHKYDFLSAVSALTKAMDLVVTTNYSPAAESLCMKIKICLAEAYLRSSSYTNFLSIIDSVIEGSNSLPEIDIDIQLSLRFVQAVQQREEGSLGRSRFTLIDLMEQRFKQCQENNPAIGAVHCELAMISILEGHFRDALKSIDQCLNIYSFVFPGDHLLVAAAQYVKGWALYAMGLFEEGLDFVEKSTITRQDKLTSSHFLVAQCGALKAQIKKSMGAYVEAEAYFLEALELQKENPFWQSEDRREVVQCLSQLGATSQYLGKYKEGLAFANEAVRVAQGVAKNLKLESDLDLASAYLLVGSLLRCLGRLEESQLRITTAKKMVSNILGEECLMAANYLFVQAELCRDVGDFRDALSLLGQCVTIRRRELGDDHPEVADVQHVMADCYLLMGRFQEAFEPLFLCYRCFVSYFGKRNLLVTQVVATRAKAVTGLGCADQADEMLQAALYGIGREIGKSNGVYINVLINTAECLRQQKKFVEAEAVLMETLVLIKTVFGATHVKVCEVLLVLAMIMRDQALTVDAKTLLEEKLLPLCQKSLGSTHPRTVFVSGLIGLCMNELEPKTGDGHIARCMQNFRENNQLSFTLEHPWIVALGGSAAADIKIPSTKFFLRPFGGQKISDAAEKNLESLGVAKVSKAGTSGTRVGSAPIERGTRTLTAAKTGGPYSTMNMTATGGEPSRVTQFVSSLPSQFSPQSDEVTPFGPSVHLTESPLSPQSQPSPTGRPLLAREEQDVIVLDSARHAPKFLKKRDGPSAPPKLGRGSARRRPTSPSSDIGDESSGAEAVVLPVVSTSLPVTRATTPHLNTRNLVRPVALDSPAVKESPGPVDNPTQAYQPKRDSLMETQAQKQHPRGPTVRTLFNLTSSLGSADGDPVLTKPAFAFLDPINSPTKGAAYLLPTISPRSQRAVSSTARRRVVPTGPSIDFI